MLGPRWGFLPRALLGLSWCGYLCKIVAVALYILSIQIYKLSIALLFGCQQLLSRWERIKSFLLLDCMNNF